MHHIHRRPFLPAKASHPNRFRRRRDNALSLFLILLLAAGVLLPLFFRILSVQAAGSTCTVTYDTKAIYYDSWSTNRFHVTDADGITRLAYCIEPRLSNTKGTYTYEVYGDEADEPYDDLFRAILMICPGGPYNTAHAPGIFRTLDSDRQVGLGHAMLSMLNCGDRTGLSDANYEFLKERLDYIRINMDQLIPRSVREQYTVYYVDTGNNSKQNIMWLAEAPAGKVTLKKTSREPALTDRNASYSLAGAVYGIYTDASCLNPAATLTTNADGTTPVIALSTGTYYVKESSAPKGYKLDATVYPITVTSAKTTTVSVSDQPLYNTGGLLLYKADSVTGPCPQGGATLAGAHFTVRYYDGIYDSVSDLPASPARSWVLETAEGIDPNESYAFFALLNEAHKVGGDDFYYDSAGKISLPLGTITIEETLAPEGYQIDNTPPVLVSITGSSADTAAKLFPGDIHTFNDTVFRGDFSLTKIASETQQPLAGVSFMITSDATGENHIFTTDANGYYSSSSDWNPHSQNTNGGDATDGLWFSGSTSDEIILLSLDEEDDTAVSNDDAVFNERFARYGSWAAQVDDSLGALPYGSYTITELEGENNSGRQMVTLSISIYRDHQVVSLNNIKNVPIEIMTTATDAADGDHELSIAESVNVTDTVSYNGLTPGEPYTFSGELIQKSTNVVLAENEITFTPSKAVGTVTVDFVADTSLLAGEELVVFEHLYHNDIEIASHADPNDTDQTITVAVSIATSASNPEDGTKDVACADEVSIVDSISYDGLIPGASYQICGELYDKETLTKISSSELTFSAKAKTGTIEIPFTADTTAFAGKDIIVYEHLLKDGAEIATHADPGSAAQTIHVNGRIQTTARAGANDSKEVEPSDGVTIFDTVSYEGLIPGKTYTLYGRLFDKVSCTDSDCLAESSLAFVPENASGTIDLAFTFDASDLCGHALVVFEKLSLEDAEIASHEDIDDENQTVYVKARIGTQITDEKDGDQIVEAAERVTVIDTISYEGLTPGTKYIIQGKLVNKDNLEILDEKQRSFVPEKENGSIEVRFTLDTTNLSGKDLVAFESLYLQDVEIASHADISDRNQTIHVREKEPGSVSKRTTYTGAKGRTSIKTGDAEDYRILLWLFLLLLAGTTSVMLIRKRQL